MRHYETTYILRPNLGEEQFNEIIDRTNAIVTNDGGVIISVARWGMKRLAYEIKKEVQGYYVYMNYAAPGTTIDEIERIFRIDDRLLRYLTVKLNDSIDDQAMELERKRLEEEEKAKIEKENDDDDEDSDKESSEEDDTEEE